MPFIQTAFFESIMPMIFETSRTSQVLWMNVKTHPVDFARNWAVKQFLECDRYKSTEWMAFLDIDMTFPPETLTMLLDAAEKGNCKCISGIYFKKNDLNETVAWKYDGDNHLIEPVMDGSVQEVSIIGMGCAVIHRTLLEKMGYPWFKYGPLHEDVAILATEDIQFCMRCKEINEKIMAHTGVICGHLMTTENTRGRIKVLDPTDVPLFGMIEKNQI
jgi:hypothetical protein